MKASWTLNTRCTSYTLTTEIPVSTLRGAGFLSTRDDGILLQTLEEEWCSLVERYVSPFGEQPTKKEKIMANQNLRGDRQNLYWVAILKDPTVKEVEEEGRGTKIIMEPTPIMASGEQAAAAKAMRCPKAMEIEDKDLNSPLTRIQVCPFVEQGL